MFNLIDYFMIKVIADTLTKDRPRKQGATIPFRETWVLLITEKNEELYTDQYRMMNTGLAWRMPSFNSSCLLQVVPTVWTLWVFFTTSRTMIYDSTCLLELPFVCLFVSLLNV